jgi:uncharacterized membrane protein YccC
MSKYIQALVAIAILFSAIVGLAGNGWPDFMEGLFIWSLCIVVPGTLLVWAFYAIAHRDRKRGWNLPEKQKADPPTL